jgi:hypothetical protein
MSSMTDDDFNQLCKQVVKHYLENNRLIEVLPRSICDRAHVLQISGFPRTAPDERTILRILFLSGSQYLFATMMRESPDTESMQANGTFIQNITSELETFVEQHRANLALTGSTT